MKAEYRFKAGEVLAYRVESALNVNLKGSHAEFLGESDQPLTWSVAGEFENAVLQASAGEPARLERRVRRIRSTGVYREDNFSFTWSRDQSPPDASRLENLIDRYVANMTSVPMQYTVDPEGASITQYPDQARLVGRLGMMTWPVRASGVTWSSVEEIAVPVLHDKIKIEFKNTGSGDVKDVGASIRKVTAVASLKELTQSEFPPNDLAFTVSGRAHAEFDLANGRLNFLELDLDVSFSGQGKLASGKMGDFKGHFTYRESQRLLTN